MYEIKKPKAIHPHVMYIIAFESSLGYGNIFMNIIPYNNQPSSQSTIPPTNPATKKDFVFTMILF